MKGSVMLLWNKEFRYNKINVYKVCTYDKFDRTILMSFIKNEEIIWYCESEDYLEIFSHVLEDFKKSFKIESTYGDNYFSGDLESMKMKISKRMYKEIKKGKKE